MASLLEQLKTALSDRFEIEREIGRGGMATVFLATDLRHDRQVAIKVLHPELAALVGSDRFLREIQISARLEHPNVLTLIDSGEAAGLPYYVMPFIDGESLRERMQREGQLPIDEALKIAGEVADGLQYAHDQDVVHRDIKPANILLYHGHALIADFGVARAVDVASAGDATATGLAVGTPKYMSPEQAAGKAHVDGRSDEYSLACVLWEMLAGEAPYDGPTPHAILARKSSDDTPSLRVRRKTVPRRLENTLEKAMSHSPADRFADAKSFGAALATGGVGVRPVRRLSRSAKRGLVAAAVVGVVALAGAGWWSLRGGSSATTSITAGGIVFLPFEERSEIEGPLEGDSIATMLSFVFRLTDQYSPVPPDEAREEYAKVCEGGPTDACGLQVASRTASELFVVGEVTAKRGDSVQIVAQMSDAAGSRAIPSVTVEGPRQDPWALFHELAKRLWIAPIEEGDRGIQLANSTTESTEALAAFLNGEMLFRSPGGNDGQEHFQRAVEIDSTFAIAWHRLAFINYWNAHTPPAFEAADRALAYSEKLSERDRVMLTAYQALMRGNVDSAEARFDRVLAEDPDDAEALYGLTQALWAYNWRRGRSQAEAQVPAGRLLSQIDDDPLGAAAYLVYALAIDGQPEAMDSVLQVYPNRGHQLGLDAHRARQAGDSAALYGILDSIRAAGNIGGLLVPVSLFNNLSRHGAIPDFAAAVYAGLPYVDSAYYGERDVSLYWNYSGRHVAYVWLASMEAGRGRWNTARAYLRGMDSIPYSPAPEYWGLFLNLPLAQPTAEDIGWIRSRVSYEALPESIPEPYSDRFTGTHHGLEAQAALYVLGTLAVRDGDFDAARSYADRIEREAAPGYAPSVSIDLAQTLRAETLLLEGRAEEALNALDAAPREVTYMEAWDSQFVGGDWVSFLRGRILHELGRLDEAISYYAYGIENRALSAAMLPASHYYRGQAYEEKGDTTQAIWHYETFAELWKDADPEYQVKRQEVLRHVAELKGEPFDVTSSTGD